MSDIGARAAELAARKITILDAFDEQAATIARLTAEKAHAEADRDAHKQALYEQTQARRQAEAKEREFLWLNHGCFIDMHPLIDATGHDDMQCKAAHQINECCVGTVDFKREPLEHLLQFASAILKFRAEQAEADKAELVAALVEYVEAGNTRNAIPKAAERVQTLLAKHAPPKTETPP